MMLHAQRRPINNGGKGNLQGPRARGALCLAIDMHIVHRQKQLLAHKRDLQLTAAPPGTSRSTPTANKKTNDDADAIFDSAIQKKLGMGRPHQISDYIKNA
jgi:hypothetical protein